ncbi:hypothetical protein PFLUV_G00008850 [Perca fluviatilis]|uniref:Uncharacterized protein n=1 Tax=Perca fluviatilis TaxID=8168 RepID=A0A6A5FNZ9_PERFL|nr:hypothetical protein PFLUV_G00008850 [Perca fluviatilis]
MSGEAGGRDVRGNRGLDLERHPLCSISIVSHRIEVVNNDVDKLTAWLTAVYFQKVTPTFGKRKMDLFVSWSLAVNCKQSSELHFDSTSADIMDCYELWKQ